MHIKGVCLIVLYIHVSCFPMPLKWCCMNKNGRKKIKNMLVNNDNHLPAIIHTRQSFFEKKYNNVLHSVIEQEVYRQHVEGELFVPRSPLVVMRQLNVPARIKKIIERYGQEFYKEFCLFYRKYKNVRGAWNLFIGNIVTMEDIDE